MFGRKKQPPTPAPVAPPAQSAALPPFVDPLSPEDRDLLETLAEDLRDCLVASDGSPLLEEAEEVEIATLPVPILEIVYADRIVELALSVHHYTEEELG